MIHAATAASGALPLGLDALFDSGADAAPAEPPTRAAPAHPTVPDDQALCQLVARIAQCDQKALAALYDATSSRVFGLARGITRNLQCAEEVTEDVYWQVWRQALRFDRQRGPVMAWLLTFARSRALDHLRRADGALTHPEPESLVDDPNDADDNPAQLLSLAQRDRCLQSALDRLDPLPRQLLSLAFYRGLTHEEISEQEHIPLGTVKSHIRRALIGLRKVLTEIDAQPRSIAS